VTVPDTEAPPDADTVKVDALIVAAFIAVLKVAVTAELIATFVAALAGVTELTAGAVGGGGGVPEPDDPPHPATANTTDAKMQATLKRMINLLSRPVWWRGQGQSKLPPCTDAPSTPSGSRGLP
jgi:hypothetical protein